MSELTFHGHRLRLILTIDGRDVDVTDAVYVHRLGHVMLDQECMLQHLDDAEAASAGSGPVVGEQG